VGGGFCRPEHAGWNDARRGPAGRLPRRRGAGPVDRDRPGRTARG